MKNSQPINAMNLSTFDPELLVKEMNLQFFASATANKVQFGLENVHYFVVTDSGTGITYGQGVPIKGAVNLSISPNGELFEFYADNIAFYSAEVNNGYDGDLEIATLPESFAIDVLGQETKDGVQFENSEQKGKQFALTFEIDGDQHKRRYVLYYCTATRPNVTGSTKSTSREPQTASLTFQARPNPYTKDIKANTTKDVAENVFNAWNTSVFERTTVTETP